MKKIIFTLVFSFLSSGCYVPMPSVGIKPTRVHHQETCKHIGSTGEVRCTHTKTYTK